MARTGCCRLSRWEFGGERKIGWDGESNVLGMGCREVSRADLRARRETELVPRRMVAKTEAKEGGFSISEVDLKDIEERARARIWWKREVARVALSDRVGAMAGMSPAGRIGAQDLCGKYV